jgi:hypothetical protein
MFDNLNDENLLLYAIKCYDTPNCVMSEFQEDYSRIFLLKKSFTKYLNANELNVRLILNHIVIIYNVFGSEGATRLMFFHLKEEHYPLLKPFLILLNFMPDVIYGIDERDILSSDISLNQEVVTCLRHLDNS